MKSRLESNAKGGGGGGGRESFQEFYDFIPVVAPLLNIPAINIHSRLVPRRNPREKDASFSSSLFSSFASLPFFFIPAAKTPTAFPSRLKTVISARRATARRDLDLISVDYRRLRAPVDKHERGIPVAPTSAPLFMLI